MPCPVSVSASSGTAHRMCALPCTAHEWQSLKPACRVPARTLPSTTALVTLHPSPPPAPLLCAGLWSGNSEGYVVMMKERLHDTASGPLHITPGGPGPLVDRSPPAGAPGPARAEEQAAAGGSQAGRPGPNVNPAPEQAALQGPQAGASAAVTAAATAAAAVEGAAGLEALPTCAGDVGDPQPEPSLAGGGGGVSGGAGAPGDAAAAASAGVPGAATGCAAGVMGTGGDPVGCPAVALAAVPAVMSADAQGGDPCGPATVGLEAGCPPVGASLAAAATEGAQVMQSAMPVSTGGTASKSTVIGGRSARAAGSGGCARASVHSAKSGGTAVRGGGSAGSPGAHTALDALPAAVAPTELAKPCPDSHPAERPEPASAAGHATAGGAPAGLGLGFDASGSAAAAAVDALGPSALAPTLVAGDAHSLRTACASSSGAGAPTGFSQALKQGCVWFYALLWRAC